MFQRKLQQYMGSTQFELGGDVGAVVFNCSDADTEVACDLTAGFVFRDQLQHASFGRGQGIKTWFASYERSGPAASGDQVRREFWTNEVAAGRYGANALDDIIRRTLLQHVAFCARIHSLVENVFVLVHGQKDDLNHQPLFACPPRHLYTV